MTICDGLTGVANVRYPDESLEREFARSRRHGRDLCLLMMDLDHFKAINDDYGHLTGDFVPRGWRCSSRSVRREELLARYGGEEFVLVLPETQLDGARAYAEALRKMVEAHDFCFEDQHIQVTVSIGVALTRTWCGRRIWWARLMSASTRRSAPVATESRP